MAKARGRLAGALTTLLLGLGLASPAVAAPGDITTITDIPVSDSGALTTDVSRGLYWIADPSGSPTGVVYAFKPDGSRAGQVRYDATPSQVEALSMFNDQLYIGDMGAGAQSFITVYRLEQLDFGASAPYSQWTLHYPDGPHEAATMMVSPRGNIWVVTKGDPGGLYYVQAPAASGEYTMMREADAPAWVTDGTFIAPTTAVLRTYNSVISYDMNAYQVTAQAPIPEQAAGESLATKLNSNGLLLGSRGSDELVEVEVPTAMGEVPAPLPSAPGSAEPEPVPEPSPTEAPSVPEPTPTGEGPGSKTFAALGIASVVSLGAGGLVFWRTKPKPVKRRRPQSR